MTVWAHHMFTTGAVLLPFFSFMTFLIAVPTGVKFFNWVGTMWRGQLSFEPAMLFTIGFLITFLFVGCHMTFLVQHWLGVMGMPRRIANYPDLPHLATTRNQISTIGSLILGASTLF